MKQKAATTLAVGAVGVLFSLPSMAQTSSVTIYGRLYPAFASFKAKDATAAGQVPSSLVSSTQGDFEQRYSVDSYNTRVGLRGREDLGGGVSAIWQIEQRVQIDTGASDFWANRDSFVGLASNFGTLRVGRFDTIHNDYGNVTNFFGIKSGHFISSTSLITDSGLGGGGTGFDTRRSNAVKYETPEFAGFQAGITYGPDELKGNPGRTIDADLWSFAAKYSIGPLYLSVQYEMHNDHFDGSITSGNAAISNVVGGVPTADASSKDTSIRFSARYQITQNHRLAGDIGQLEYKESGQAAAGRFESYKKIIWQIGWEASWGGPWRTAVSFAQADDGKCTLSGGVSCTTAGLKASEIAAGVAYDFSKRTFVYAAFSILDLDPSALYDNWTNGTPPRGSEITQWGLGIAHSF
jgi:predicted porin